MCSEGCHLLTISTGCSQRTTCSGGPQMATPQMRRNTSRRGPAYGGGFPTPRTGCSQRTTRSGGWEPPPPQVTDISQNNAKRFILATVGTNYSFCPYKRSTLASPAPSHSHSCPGYATSFETSSMKKSLSGIYLSPPPGQRSVTACAVTERWPDGGRKTNVLVLRRIILATSVYL